MLINIFDHDTRTGDEFTDIRWIKYMLIRAEIRSRVIQHVINIWWNTGQADLGGK